MHINRNIENPSSSKAYKPYLVCDKFSTNEDISSVTNSALKKLWFSSFVKEDGIDKKLLLDLRGDYLLLHKYKETDKTLAK